MSSTIERGNAFRDVVESLLEAAGYRCKSEVRSEFKKVDIEASVDDAIYGLQTFFLETKDYSTTLGLDVCGHFAVEYGALVQQGHAKGAILISKNPISPDGRKLIEAHHGLQCYTFREFQRRLLGVEEYLRSLISTYEIEGLSKYYIPPRVSGDEDLATFVAHWLDDRTAPPIAVIGGYGTGKSTFATHITIDLARKAMKDPGARVPIDPSSIGRDI
jgi:hypothetical protein